MVYRKKQKELSLICVIIGLLAKTSRFLIFNIVNIYYFKMLGPYLNKDLWFNSITVLSFKGVLAPISILKSENRQTIYRVMNPSTNIFHYTRRAQSRKGKRSIAKPLQQRGPLYTDT